MKATGGMFRIAASGLVVVFLAGCALTIRDSEMSITNAPPANSQAILITVETPVPNIQGDQYTLLVALRKEFTASGYRLESGGLILRATITRLHRGNNMLNLLLQLGLGSDVIDVRVEVSDTNGTSYMTFLVRGEVLDKRYAEMSEVIRGIATRIAADIKQASQ